MTAQSVAAINTQLGQGTAGVNAAPQIIQAIRRSGGTAGNTYVVDGGPSPSSTLSNTNIAGKVVMIDCNDADSAETCVTNIRAKLAGTT